MQNKQVAKNEGLEISCALTWSNPVAQKTIMGKKSQI